MAGSYSSAEAQSVYSTPQPTRQLFVEVYSNNLTECSTSGSINSQYFSVMFRDHLPYSVVKLFNLCVPGRIL